ncbi:MAG: LapA family protein [Betaproteobacteria bacterium]|nr:LapA family protein [Betaproteobacteria bacterium]
MSIIRWAIVIVIFLAALLLSFSNSDQVTLHFLGFGSWQAPLILIVFCAFALGVMFGLLTGVFRMAKVKRELKKARKALLAYEKNSEPNSDVITIRPVSPSPDTLPTTAPKE